MNNQGNQFQAQAIQNTDPLQGYGSNKSVQITKTTNVVRQYTKFSTSLNIGSILNRVSASIQEIDLNTTTSKIRSQNAGSNSQSSNLRVVYQSQSAFNNINGDKLCYDPAYSVLIGKKDQKNQRLEGNYHIAYNPNQASYWQRKMGDTQVAGVKVIGEGRSKKDDLRTSSFNNMSTLSENIRVDISLTQKNNLKNTSGVENNEKKDLQTIVNNKRRMTFFPLTAKEYHDYGSSSKERIEGRSAGKFLLDDGNMGNGDAEQKISHFKTEMKEKNLINKFETPGLKNNGDGSHISTNNNTSSRRKMVSLNSESKNIEDNGMTFGEFEIQNKQSNFDFRGVKETPQTTKCLNKQSNQEKDICPFTISKVGGKILEVESDKNEDDSNSKSNSRNIHEESDDSHHSYGSYNDSKQNFKKKNIYVIEPDLTSSLEAGFISSIREDGIQSLEEKQIDFEAKISNHFSDRSEEGEVEEDDDVNDSDDDISIEEDKNKKIQLQEIEEESISLKDGERICSMDQKIESRVYHSLSQAFRTNTTDGTMLSVVEDQSRSKSHILGNYNNI